MKGLSDFAYAQVRMQSRFGSRAETGVWLKLHTIHDLGSYLQVARQTALRHWVLGINPTHNSHDIELALRQKYRQHVDEVAGWLPSAWQKPVRWIKRLADLPVLQYLAAGGQPLEWMKSDPDTGDLTTDSLALRLELMRQAGYSSLVDAWQKGDTMFVGWLSHWNSIRPENKAFNQGLLGVEKLLREQLQLLAGEKKAVLPTDYDALDDRLRTLFRRYLFQPAAVCAYLASVAIDVHHLRSDLMQRLFFLGGEDMRQGLPE
jgi:hypothetical protein